MPDAAPTASIDAPDPLLAAALAGAVAAAGLRIVDAEASVLLADLGPLGDGPVPAAAAPVLALVPDAAAAARALASGARGALARTVDPARLGPALRAVAAGLLVVEPGFLPTLAVSAPPVASPLSPREHDVLELLAEGLSNKEIGHRLFVSANTVRFHVGAILEKLDASTRTEAVVRGARLGLLDL
jgi:DNA-binding NarL/FixJ family response regulator